LAKTKIETQGENMIARTLLFLGLIALPVLGNASQMPASKDPYILMSEYKHFKELCQSLEPDGLVGGYAYFKKFEGYELLWHLADDESGVDFIHIYVEDEAPSKDFSVKYYRSQQILPGRTVLRRFVGPTQNGWRNDTIDYITGDYLGSQGAPSPRMSDGNRALLKELGITLLELDL
tara:strand:+ start:20707 stop:21237 length:531 start_codon:yes stop_codon:yes gene_type:complete